MMKIDALYFLLLIELVLLLAVSVVVLVFRGKKLRALHQAVVQELEQERKAQEDLKKQLAEAGSGTLSTPQHSETGDAAAAAEAMTVAQDKLRIELSAVQVQLKDKTTKLNDLQAKFDDLEKEYLILYRQQQKDAEKNQA